MPDEPNTTQPPNTNQGGDLDIDKIPDVVPTENVAGLKSTLSKFKATNDDLKAQNEKLAADFQAFKEQFANVNPDEFAKMQAAEQEAQRLQDELARTRTTIESELKDQYGKIISEKDAAAQAANAKYVELNRRTINQQHFLEAGGKPEHFANLDVMVQKYFETNELGEITRVMDPIKGTPIYVSDKDNGTREITPAEFYLDCRKGKYGEFLQIAFEPYNKSSGSGMTAGIPGKDGVVMVPRGEMSNFMAGNGNPEQAIKNTKLVQQGKVQFID